MEWSGGEAPTVLYSTGLYLLYYLLARSLGWVGAAGQMGQAGRAEQSGRKGECRVAAFERRVAQIFLSSELWD